MCHCRNTIRNENRFDSKPASNHNSCHSSRRSEGICRSTRSESAPQVDPWSPDMAFPTSVLSNCTVPGSVLTLACSWNSLHLCSTERKNTLLWGKKESTAEIELCFVVVFRKNGLSPTI